MCPLLTSSREEYKALTTQSVGRVCRLGQTKKVTVHHLLSPGTADINIYETQEGQKLVLDGRRLKHKAASENEQELASRLCGDVVALRRG